MLDLLSLGREDGSQKSKADVELTRLVHYYRDLLRPSGVTAAIHGWQKALIDEGFDTIALHAGSEPAWPLESLEIPHVGQGRQLSIPILKSVLRPGDVLILHEGWISSNLAAAFQARRLGIPYIVVPHGVYDPNIMRHLKAPYHLRRFLESGMLRQALAAHVFYDNEIDFVRKFAPNLKMLSASTGLELPEEKWSGGGGYLAWFGRYSVEHKGLDQLLASYALTSPDVRLPLRLHGVDYHGGMADVVRIVERLGLSNSVTVGGPVMGSDKNNLLKYCEGFVFPSRWESHSIALMESIAMGVPTLVSSSLHAAEPLDKFGAVQIVDFSIFTSASRAIETFYTIENLSPKARQYMIERLDWARVTKEFRIQLESLAGAR